MSAAEKRFVIASDVNPRDGIGIEIYEGDELILEIFRDDSEKTRTITIFKENISLQDMEESIQKFKKEIPWEFIDDESTTNS